MDQVQNDEGLDQDYGEGEYDSENGDADQDDGWEDARMEEFISVKMDTPKNRSIDVDLQNNSYNNDYNPRRHLVLNDQSL